MPTIHFKATLHRLDTQPGDKPWIVLTIPIEVSTQLPTRGMTMVDGIIGGTPFQAPLEPNGKGSHWFRVDSIGETIGAADGDTIDLEITPTKIWPEPDVPKHVEQALAADPEAQAQWFDITTMARWDWLRWMDAVKLAETRKERPAKLCSMLKSGKRRPCCFNRVYRTPPKPATLL